MDPAVNERRLRSVFDAIDVGNNKKALQEVEKVLKKTPNLKTAIALKALALIRLGREKESVPLIEDLEKSEPDDDATLQVMTYCFRELDQLKKICSVYHNAAKKQPGNDEILSQLFMAHVRVNDYKSQQIVALQLYKAKPKNPYYFWAVMSIVLQAVRGPEAKDKVKSKNLLLLAQRMVDKIIDGKKVEAEQEVQLYLNILEHQEKFEETLSFLDSEVCQEHFPGAPITIKIELLKKLKQWSKLKEVVQELLVEDPDRWDYHKDYLLASFELIKSGDASTTIESCNNFISKLEADSKGKVRGPFLARFEMHKMMRDLKLDADNLLGGYQDLLLNYFRKFGNKKCCANDLKLFLDFLDPAQRPQLASKLIQDTGISSTTLPQDKDQLQRHICSLQISRLCGAHSALSAEHLQALYSALSLHYEHSFSSFDTNLLPTDIGLSDQYALLAAHVMYDLAVKMNSTERLVETLHLLNYLLRNSPSNFHAKLLCLQIYHILGCALGAHKIYVSLDVKHVQLDSLGYLHCAHLPLSGIVTLAKPIYDQTLKFFTASYKDSLEYLAMSYKFGSFSKLQEFMDFRERLSNSLHYSMTSVEALIQEIVCFNGSNQQNLLQFHNMRIEPNEDRIKYDELMDNRDLEVMIRWDPTHRYSTDAGESLKEPVPIQVDPKEREKESFVQDTELLQMRSSLLRLVAASVDLIHTPRGANTKELNGHEDDSVGDPGENFNLLLTSWKELFSLTKKLNPQPSSSQFLVNLLPSRLHFMIQLPYDEVFLTLASLVYQLWLGSEKVKEASAAFVKSLSTVKSSLESLKQTQPSGAIFEYRIMQGNLVGCIEILSLCSFVLSSCLDKFNQSQSQSSKKKKQSNGVIGSQPIEVLSGKEKLSMTIDVLRELRSVLTISESSLEKLKPVKVDKTLEEYLATLSITPKPATQLPPEPANSVISTADIDVHTIFDESFQQSSKELSALIKDKLRMINVK